MIHVLEIGHVDVHYVLKELQGLNRVVASRIVHYGKVQPPGYGTEKGPGDGVYLVGGRDKIDIVTPSALQGEHHCGKIFAGDLFATAKMGYIIVLAEYAVKVAVGEKDGARAAPS